VRHSHCAPYCAPASNSEIETGAIRAAKSSPHGAVYGAVRRVGVAALIMHAYKHNDSAPVTAPYVRRRWSADSSCLLRRTARSVNATLDLMRHSHCASYGYGALRRSAARRGAVLRRTAQLLAENSKRAGLEQQKAAPCSAVRRCTALHDALIMQIMWCGS